MIAAFLTTTSIDMVAQEPINDLYAPAFSADLMERHSGLVAGVTELCGSVQPCSESGGCETFRR